MGNPDDEILSKAKLVLHPAEAPDQVKTLVMTDEQIGATMAACAAIARMQALEMKRYPAPGEPHVLLTAAEQAELYRLKVKWWNNVDHAKQVRLLLLMKELAEDIEDVFTFF